MGGLSNSGKDYEEKRKQWIQFAEEFNDKEKMVPKGKLEEEFKKEVLKEEGN
jgi:hypothetical protein